MNLPEAAVVLCADEKTRIQAIDRTAPVLPLLPGTPQRRTRDYRRFGTTNLYAALDAAPGRDERVTLRLVTAPKPRRKPDRWDGWDDPDYQPTEDELNEPIVIPGIEMSSPASKPPLLKRS